MLSCGHWNYYGFTSHLFAPTERHVEYKRRCRTVMSLTGPVSKEPVLALVGHYTVILVLQYRNHYKVPPIILNRLVTFILIRESLSNLSSGALKSCMSAISSFTAGAETLLLNI